MAEEKFVYVIQCIDDDSVPMVEGEPSLSASLFPEAVHGRFSCVGGGSEKRMAVYEDHKAYQAMASNPDSDHFIEKLSAGPLLSEDGFFSLSLISLSILSLLPLCVFPT